MQLHAAFHNGQAEAGPRNLPDVSPSMKGGEEMITVSQWDPDAFVTHGEKRVTRFPRDTDSDRTT